MASNSDSSSVDFVDVFAVVLYLGLGLTSLSLAIWPISPTRYDMDLSGLLTDALNSGAEAPAELLVGGAGLEDLVVEPFPDVEGIEGGAVRLVSTENPPNLLRDRFWVVRQNGESLEPPAGYGETLLQTGDSIELVEWHAEEAERDVQLSDRIRSANAAYVPRNGERESYPCKRWLFGRLFCGPDPWNWIGEQEVVINGQPERCVWAHPRAGHELRITFPDFRFQSPLRGRYALADRAVEHQGGSPVTFRVEVDGTERVKRVLPNRRGWNVFSLRPDKGDADEVELTFVVSAPSDAQRHFCFDATIGGGRRKGARP